MGPQIKLIFSKNLRPYNRIVSKIIPQTFIDTVKAPNNGYPRKTDYYYS